MFQFGGGQWQFENFAYFCRFHVRPISIFSTWECLLNVFTFFPNFRFLFSRIRSFAYEGFNLKKAFQCYAFSDLKITISDLNFKSKVCFMVSSDLKKYISNLYLKSEFLIFKSLQKILFSDYIWSQFCSSLLFFALFSSKI